MTRAEALRRIRRTSTPERIARVPKHADTCAARGDAGRIEGIPSNASACDCRPRGFRYFVVMAAAFAALASMGCGLYADGPDEDIRTTPGAYYYDDADDACRDDYGDAWGACSHAGIGNAPAGWGVDGGAWIDAGGRRFACAYVDEWGAIHAQTSHAFCGGRARVACCAEFGPGSDPR